MRSASMRLRDVCPRRGATPRRSGCARSARAIRADGRRLVDLFDDLDSCCRRRRRVVADRGAALRRSSMRLLVGLDVALADVLVRRRHRRRRLGVGARRRQGATDGADGAIDGGDRRARSRALHALVVRRELQRASSTSSWKRSVLPVSRAMRAISFCTSMAFAAWPICVKARASSAERVEVARVRLEADLQLRERLHAVVRGWPRARYSSAAMRACAGSALWWSRRSMTLSASSRRPSFASCPARDAELERPRRRCPSRARAPRRGAGAGAGWSGRDRRSCGRPRWPPGRGSGAAAASRPRRARRARRSSDRAAGRAPRASARCARSAPRAAGRASR